MFHSISERIIVYAVKTEALDKDKTEEYIYGLELSLSVFASYFSVVIIGIIRGMMWQSILFLFLFVSVRRFAGGFHFKSQIVCYLFMCIVCIVALLVIKYGENNIVIYSAAMAASTLLLLALSPVPAIEKPLDDKEKIVYGRITKILLAIIACVYTVLCLFNNVYAAKIISVTMFIITVFAILGKIKYEWYNCKKAAL